MSHPSETAHRPSLGERRTSRVRFSVSEAGPLAYEQDIGDDRAYEYQYDDADAYQAAPPPPRIVEPPSAHAHTHTHPAQHPSHFAHANPFEAPRAEYDGELSPRSTGYAADSYLPPEEERGQPGRGWAGRQQQPQRQGSIPVPPLAPVQPLYAGRGRQSSAQYDPRRDSDSTLTDAHVNSTVQAGQSLKAAEKRGSTCSCQHAPDVAARPLKPALRRSITEEVVDPSLQARQEATALVDSHVHRLHHHGQHPPHTAPRHTDRERDDTTITQFNPFDWKHGDEEAPHGGNGQPKAGVLSNLLKLTSTGLGRSPTSSSWASGTSVAPSRAASGDSRDEGIRQRSRRRRNSDLSATSEYALDEKGGKKGKEEDEIDDEKFPSRRRRSSSVSMAPPYRSKEDKAKNEEDAANLPKHKRHQSRKLRRLSITVHVADVLMRHKFILKLTKALMQFGAPSHRIEAQLNAMADVLDVDGHFVHLPSIVIASFGDQDTHTTETHFVKAGGGLNLGSLTEVHEIYRRVAHDEVGVEVGLQQLIKLLAAKPLYGLWTRVLIALVCAGTICMLGFSGSFVDGLISSLFGGILAFLQIRVAASNPMYSNIFEISMATLVSFAGRGLASTSYFCYEAISSSGVVLILPGYIILCGSLELASRNIIAGSVKLVYSIIYSLFLGFGIAIGSDVYYLFDHSARAQAAATVDGGKNNFVSSMGLLTFANTSYPALNGTFTLTNATAGLPVDTGNSAALKSGSVVCIRDPSWEWWRQEVSPWWAFLLVPLFSSALSLWNLQPIRDRQFPVMVVIAIIGYITNRVANTYIFNRSDIVSFIGALCIGLSGNIYSRLCHGTAFTAMVTGVLFLVPSGIAAAGGLAITEKTDDGDSYSNGLLIGFRMIQVAIGITVGLFLSSFLVYSFFSGRKRSAVLFAF